MLEDSAATDEHGQVREEQQHQGLGDVVEDGQLVQQRPQATADHGDHHGHKRAACSCSSPLNSADAEEPDAEDALAARERKRPRLLACPGSSASLPHAAPLDAGTSPGSPGADTEQGGESSCSPPVPSLLVLPPEVLELVLSKLDAYSLAVMPRCCKAFRVLDKASHLRVTEKVARDQVLERCGPAHSQRWRKHSWLERLRFEEVATMFDRKRAEAAGFSFVTSASGTLSVKLDGIGPKLLVSDMCTADCPLLRWRLELKGNNAVEFGVVPVAVQEQPKALHKCLPVDGDQRPVGFSSSITVGSLLPMKVPLMKGSVVEVLARSDRVEFIVTNPPNGTEMTWQNNITVPKPYKGPREFRFEQDYHSTGPVKLAVTAWARAAFDVLHIKT